MEFRRYWETILRYKVFILSLVVCASAGALAATYILSETYTASALVLVRPLDTRRVTDPPAGMKEKEVLGFPLVGTEAKVFGRSYAEIIQSRTVAKQIVDSLGLDKLPKPVEPSLLKRAWKYVKNKVKEGLYITWIVLRHGRFERPDPYDYLVDMIKATLTVSEVRDTYLVQIEAKADDPAFAALIANSAAKVFVDHWRQAYHEETKQDLGILEVQLAYNDAEVNELRNELEEYKRKEGIIDLNVEIPAKVSSLSHFESKLRQATADIQSLQKEKEEVQRQLASRQKVATASSIESENPVVVNLRQTLSSLEIEMAGLKSRFTPSHHDVLAVQAKIDETREKLAKAEARTVSDVTSTVDPVFEGMEERLAFLDTKLPALEAKRKGYQANIEQYQREVEALQGKMKELNNLERKLDTLEGINSNFVSGVKDFRVLMTKNPEEIRVVSSAAPPLYPSGPIKIYYAGIAAGVGLIIGLTLAFFLEYLNTRVRTIEEAEAGLDLPVLATIPQIGRLAGAKQPEILIAETRTNPS